MKRIIKFITIALFSCLLLAIPIKATVLVIKDPDILPDCIKPAINKSVCILPFIVNDDTSPVELSVPLSQLFPKLFINASSKQKIFKTVFMPQSSVYENQPITFDSESIHLLYASAPADYYIFGIIDTFHYSTKAKNFGSEECIADFNASGTLSVFDNHGKLISHSTFNKKKSYTFMRDTSLPALESFWRLGYSISDFVYICSSETALNIQYDIINSINISDFNYKPQTLEYSDRNDNTNYLHPDKRNLSNSGGFYRILGGCAGMVITSLIVYTACMHSSKYPNEAEAKTFAAVSSLLGFSVGFVISDFYVNETQKKQE